MMDVGIVISNTKELQRERNVLETKLRELRSRRMQLESKMDSLNQRFGQVKNVHAKMSETLKVSQHKVWLTQNQMDSQEKVNSERASVVDSCEEEVKKEVENQREKIINFQDHLDNLSEQMLQAYNNYTEENLMKDIAERNKELKACEIENLHATKETEMLTKNLVEENGEQREPEVPVEEQMPLIMGAKRELQKHMEYLEVHRKRNEELKKKLSNLKDEY